jgi:hypothetical protein
MSEARDWSFEDLWFSSLHQYPHGEEDKVGAFRIEGNIFWVQRDLKILQNHHSTTKEDNCE